MAVDLSPEQQELVDNVVRSGAYADAGQVVGRALEMLRLEEEWLRANRNVINEKIARGLAQLDRGKSSRGDEVYARLQAKKADFLAKLKR